MTENEYMEKREGLLARARKAEKNDDKTECHRILDEIDSLDERWNKEKVTPDFRLPLNDGQPPRNDSDGIRFLKHEDKLADHYRSDERTNQTTTGRIIQGMIRGWDGMERDHRSLVGSEDPQGGYLLPAPMSARMIDLARARMVLSQAGAVTVPIEADSLTIPKLLADPTPYWRGELETITQSSPSFSAIVLKPKAVAILTLVSHEVWEDASGLGRAVEDAMSQALAHEIDRVGLMGGGEGNTNEPVGIYHTAGITSVSMATDGAVPTDYDKFLDVIEELEDENGEPTHVIFNPRTKRTLAGLVTGITSDKTKLEPPEDFRNLRRLITTAIPNDLTWGSNQASSAAFMGGFNNLYMGVRDRVRIDVSPHGSGAFDKMGLWVRAFARVDFALVRPGLVARLGGIRKA